MELKLSPKVLKKELKTKEYVAEATHQSVFADTQHAYEVVFADYPLWERAARSVAYMFDHQTVDIRDDDVVIGRYNYKIITPGTDKNAHPRQVDTDLSYLYTVSLNALFADILEKCPEVRTDFMECGIHGDAFWNGHECHSFQVVLHKGLQGIIDLSKRYLERTKDDVSNQFYQGVIMTIEAIIRWNQRHVEELKRRGMMQQAAVCSQVPQHPARNFREAVQAVNMVYYTVTQEANGTWGPGWIDYYLWPYLEKDLREGTITEQEAFDLCGYLLINLNARPQLAERHNDTICLGGSHPNGLPAISTLTYLLAKAALQLDITSILVYLKMPENPPEEYVKFAAQYLIEGRNRGQILNDQAIASSLEYRGSPYDEALSYTTNGCMEISCSQANSDMLLCGWHNMAKLVEMSITGNQCLLTKKQYDSLLFRGLENYTDFSSYYDDFVKECRRVLHQYFSCIDIFSEKIAVYCPTYFASSLLNDCMIRGRSQHNGGTRYHDYGTAPLALANAADSLFAVKKAVFDNKICTANELVDALWHNYSGYETLRLRLLAIPKYGQDHEEADAFAKQYFDDICDIYESYENRWRGVVKPIIFTFVWAGECASHLGAAADGHFAHTFASQGTTPHSSAMTEGLTAAIISNCRMPMIRFTGGGTSMWDFDESWVNPTVMEYFLTTFLSLGGQMFQGNSSVSPEELRKAQADPDAYKHLIVRVGGFSAHFVDLTRDVQDDIIHRHRHNK